MLGLWCVELAEVGPCVHAVSMLQFLHCTEVFILWWPLPMLCGAVRQERCPCLSSQCVVERFLCQKDVGGTVDTRRDDGLRTLGEGRGGEGNLCAIALIKEWPCLCTFLPLAIVKDQSYELNQLRGIGEHFKWHIINKQNVLASGAFFSCYRRLPRPKRFVY